MPDWSSAYDGFKGTNSRKTVPQPDRHGRLIPHNPGLDRPMNRFFENVDVEKLELFLGQSDKYSKLIEALANPKNAKVTLIKLCRLHDITLHELQSIYTDGMRQLGYINMANALPKIAEDVGEDAQTRLVVCPRCDGAKELVEVKERDEQGKPTLIHTRDCPVCKGVGEVRQVGDKHARDLVFESMKLTGQKGPMVAIQNNFGGGVDGLDVRMEDMLKRTQQIALGDGGVQQKQTSTEAVIDVETKVDD